MKPFEKILIPTDGSDNAKAAVAQGLALAKIMDAEVTALNVVDIGEFYTRRGLRRADVDNYPILEEEAKTIVEQVRQEGEQMGVVVKKLVRKGVPENEIVAVSKDYDLIVMGTLGRTGLDHFFIGSVAERVVRFASCPVLIIRAQKAS